MKPVAIISGFSGTTRDGHKQHQTAGILTRQAYRLAADPQAFPEQIEEGLLPWQTPYLLVRNFRGEGDAPQIKIPVGEIAPNTGKTYEEIGWEGFRKHASQGMGNINFTRGRAARFRSYLHSVVATASEATALPAGVEGVAPMLSELSKLFPALVLGDIPPLEKAVALAQGARSLAATRPAQAAKMLVEGVGELRAAHLAVGAEFELRTEEQQRDVRRAQAWLEEKQQAFLQAAAHVATIRLRAAAARAHLTPGSEVEVSVGVEVGNPGVLDAAGFKMSQLELLAPDGWKVERRAAAGGASERQVSYLVQAPSGADPEVVSSPALRARIHLQTGELETDIETPVLGLWGEPERIGLTGLVSTMRRGVRQLDPRRLLHLLNLHREEEKPLTGYLEPVRLVPALTVTVEPKLWLLAASDGGGTREFSIDVESHSSVGEFTAWFDVPSGWYTPEPRTAKLPKAEQIARRWFDLTFPEKLVPGRHELKVKVGRGRESFTQSLRRIERGSRADGAPNPPLYIYEPASLVVQVVDTDVPKGLRVGYIGFSDDPVPELLEDLGITAERLDERALAVSDLSQYHTIVIANRVYDLRKDLETQNARLLDYVEQGGVLLVEHQGRRWDPKKFAPYPGERSGRPRVTVETAPVKMLVPNHPVLRYPNRIGPEDWDGWVQERGLYFWTKWPQQYTPLLEMADPGEEPQQGSLLYARYGKGAYIYCGLALFRQVRAGVSGGVRLYVNLLSQGVRLTR